MQENTTTGALEAVKAANTATAANSPKKSDSISNPVTSDAAKEIGRRARLQILQNEIREMIENGDAVRFEQNEKTRRNGRDIIVIAVYDSQICGICGNWFCGIHEHKEGAE